MMEGWIGFKRASERAERAFEGAGSLGGGLDSLDESDRGPAWEEPGGVIRRKN